MHRFFLFRKWVNNYSGTSIVRLIERLTLVYYDYYTSYYYVLYYDLYSLDSTPYSTSYGTSIVRLYASGPV